MNFAAVGNAPVVFVCQNNGWAISVPTEKQTRSQTFAQKAFAYGIPAYQADGNDLFASFKVCRDAVRHARAGNGPSLVELTTYRIADHTTVDDSSRYRSKEEHERGLAADPLIRTRLYLEARGKWDEDAETEARERAKRIVKEVVATAMEIEKPTIADAFNHAFAEPTRELIRQRETNRTGSIGQSPKQPKLSRIEADEAVTV